ncbi:MAG: hypothetical protein HYX75_13065 [Acidobacteria bacterium]|nr:hypothetical protein [Acidobacteriota bacterium]
MKEDEVSAIAPTPAWRGGLVTAAIILVGGISASFSIDPVRTGFGLRGDESTYIMMGLSAAADGDLVYERRDILRYWSLYSWGPEGIFLKRGKEIHLDLQGGWPFLKIDKRPDRRDDRLYFGKAFSYPVAAAPFVRLAGLRGFFVFHAFLLAGCFLAANAFLSARSEPRAARLFTLAFLFMSVVPLYVVRLYSDFFIFCMVLFGYFFWLYKELAPSAPGRWARFLRSPASDIFAAFLLGLAVYSKPIFILLGAPPILTHFWRRRWPAGFRLGCVYAFVIAALFGLNAVVTGEINYQGGDRRTFYGTWPFQTPDLGFEDCGTSLTTNRFETESMFEKGVFLPQLARNTMYFFVGRHAGLIPYFFPAVVAMLLWLRSPARRDCWRVFALGGVAGTALFSLLWMVRNWAGGGGQPGNRYFLPGYAVMLFLVPPLRTAYPSLIAAVGGAMFLAHMIINPFYSSAMTWMNPQNGLLRLLPVELTMPNDLPVQLNQGRARVPYGGEDPALRVSFLDENASAPEAGGIWVYGNKRAEILVSTWKPLSSLNFELHSFVENSVRLSAGGGEKVVTVPAHESVFFELPVEGQYAEWGHHYLLSIECAIGAAPRLTIPAMEEPRYLGVYVKFTGRNRDSQPGP